MSKKPETRLQQAIQRALKKAWPLSRWFKVWGGPFQEAGISDLLGCVEGMYVALEVKLPGKDYEEPSDIQKKFIRDIKRAGGIASVVTSTRDAVVIVREGLRSTRSVPEGRDEVVPRKEQSRFILRARNREDLDNGRRLRGLIKDPEDIRRFIGSPARKP